jgi:isoleucyl-tRNA synthetase
MARAQEVVTIGHAARNKAGIKVRQPLAGIVVRGWPREQLDAWREVDPIVRDELNVKHIRLADEGEELAAPVVKLDFAKLGPRLGAKVKLLAQRVQTDVVGAAKALRAGATWRVEVEGEAVEVNPDEVTIHYVSPQGWVFQAEGAFEVLLDVTITPALAREGAARDLVRHIQSLRKDTGLDVSDRIIITFTPVPGVEEVLAEQGDYLAQEVLATSIAIGEPGEGDAVTQCAVGESTVTIALRRAGH